jgi:intein/homing endonuclease
MLIIIKNLILYVFALKDLKKNETINEKIFSKIETEEQAYWLGFLYADGYVSKDSNRIELTLKDEEHVKKFANFLNISLSKIKEKTAMNKIYYKLSFRNVQIRKDLISAGCIPQKSLKIVFPNEYILPKNLVNHFVRGYFDGDGCLAISPRDNAPRFALDGTKEFLDKIKEIYNLPETKYGRDGKAFLYRTCANASVKFFLTSLYKNSKIYLDRKYKIFLDCRFE